MTEEERQAGERVRELSSRPVDPDITLLDMWLSGRLHDVAQRFDRGGLAADDVEPAMAAAAEAANVALRHQQLGLQAARNLGDRAPVHIAGGSYGLSFM